MRKSTTLKVRGKQKFYTTVSLNHNIFKKDSPFDEETPKKKEKGKKRKGEKERSTGSRPSLKGQRERKTCEIYEGGCRSLRLL